jgi:sulfotransferase family protein
VTRHFLVIGAQRCGTTWLHHQLEAHPQIAMARPTRPEPKVFLDDLATEQDRAWYADRWFGHATPGQVLGEKSTSYVDRPDAIARIQALLGDVPLVVQLRDPLARAVSHWRFSHENGLEQRSLTDALSANLEGPLPWDPSATSVSPYAYLERGRYVEALRPWLAGFGDLVHVQFLEEMVARPGLFAETLAHVGVDPDVTLEVDLEPVNRSRGDDEGDVLDPSIAAAVRQSFAESDRELEALLGRSLPWVASETAPTHTRRDEDPLR